VLLTFGCSQDAIDTHRNEKCLEGEARPVSFAEFVEELDAKDAFTARLMEILVKVCLGLKRSYVIKADRICSGI
jgi:hypothetical protein